MSERIGGRFVSKAQFERRRKCSTLLQGRHRTEKRNEAEYVQNVGRRIVDIQLLAEAMWCDTCDVPLSFRFMEKEVQRGLASVFSIRCKTCYEVKEVMSSSQVHTSSGAFYPVYAINCKAALGCLDSGIAHEQFNCCLTAMNILPITRSTLKRAESRVAPAVVAVAEESCKNAVQQEKELTVSLGTPTQSTSVDVSEDPHASDVDIIATYDFGWSKRGNGRCHDSPNGQGSVIGYQTKKIIAFDTRSTRCALCGRGHPASDNFCRKNWSGSSKAMEPNCAVNLIAKYPVFKEAGIRVGVLVGDEDSSTIAAVQKETPHVEKWVDTNHNTKNVNNKLYLAAKKYKFLNHGVIKYLKRCFSYCIAQNKNNVPNQEFRIHENSKVDAFF